MRKESIRTSDEALSYMTDCTLATVSSMAMKKSRSKSEFRRQISIAQTGINWIRDFAMGICESRIEEVKNLQWNVEKWAEQYYPEVK